MGVLISKLLFQPPETPTPMDQRKYFWLKTKNGSKIPVFHIKQPNARFTVLYSHGNAEGEIKDQVMINVAPEIHTYPMAWFAYSYFGSHRVLFFSVLLLRTVMFIHLCFATRFGHDIHICNGSITNVIHQRNCL